MKISVDEIKSTLKGMKSRLEDTEEWVNDLEDRVKKALLLNSRRKKNSGK